MTENLFAGKALDDILNEATDLTDNEVEYITNVRFRATNNDITLDLYRVVSDPKSPNAAISFLVKRVIMSPSLAKNVGNILIDLSTRWEDTFGISLPIAPTDIGEETDEVE